MKNQSVLQAKRSGFRKDLTSFVLLSSNKKTSLLIILFSVFLFQNNLFAYPEWVVGAYTTGDECSEHQFHVTSSFPTPHPNNAYLIVTLQSQTGVYNSWVNEATFTTLPGLIVGTVATFNIDPFSAPPGPWNPPVSISYRAVVELVEPQGNHSLTTNSHSLLFPSHNANAEVEIENTTFNGNYYPISNCAPENYTLIFNENGIDIRTIEVSIHTSDASGTPGSLLHYDHWTVPIGGTGPAPITFHMFMQMLNTQFNNIILNELGYVLIDVTFEDWCQNTSHNEVLLIQINEIPYVSDFELIYADPAGDPFYNGPYPWDALVSQPSHNVNNPVELGNFTGGIFITATSTHFEKWELTVSRDQGQGFDAVGQMSGTNPAGLVGYFRLSNPEFYNHSGFNLSDNPAMNLDETYMVELTLTTPECDPSYEYSYFEFPSSLFGKRTTSSGDKNTLNHWVGQSTQEQMLSLHIDEKTPAREVNVEIFSVDGRKVYEAAKLSPGTSKFSLQVPKGVYILRAFDEQSQELYTTKVMF